jgi:hypothetical protein
MTQARRKAALAGLAALVVAAQTLNLPKQEALDHWRQEPPLVLQRDLHHVQGIDVEGNYLWVSSVDAKAGKGYLTKLDLATGRLLAQVEVQEGAHIHPGGITLDGDSLWIPVAEYDRDGPTSVQRRDKQTLALESSFDVKDHIGCIAAAEGFLVGGSWSSRTIYSWSKDGRERFRRANPHPTAWQDLKMDGELLIGSGDLSNGRGVVEWVSLPSLELVRRIDAGRTERGVPFTHEGMTWRGGVLFLLPEDAPSRLFRFTPPQTHTR